MACPSCCGRSTAANRRSTRRSPSTGLNFPVVDANVISDATGQPLLPPYVVKRIGGVRVGFIGATTITTPTIVTTGGTDGVHFVDEADAINKYVGVLEHQGVHAFVAVVHEGGRQSNFPVGTVNDRINDIASRLDPAVSVRGLRTQPHRGRHPGRACAGDPGRRRSPRPTTTCTCCSTAARARSRPAGDRCSRRGGPTAPSTTDPSAAAVTPDPAVQQIVDAAVPGHEPDHAAGDQPRVHGHPVAARGWRDTCRGVAGRRPDRRRAARRRPAPSWPS